MPLRAAILCAVGEYSGIRALLFDLGGILIDFDFRRAFACWAEDADCDPSDIAKRFSFDEPYQRHERGDIQVSEYFGLLRAELGVTLTDEQLLKGWNGTTSDPLRAQLNFSRLRLTPIRCTH